MTKDTYKRAGNFRQPSHHLFRHSPRNPQMEKYTVPAAPISQNPNPNTIKRSQWKRNLIELNGKPVRSYRHDVSPMLMRSYSQIGAFDHKYYVDRVDHRSPCSTHINQFYPISSEQLVREYPEFLTAFRPDGVAAVEFDAKGIYLASGTRAGCLTVHEFESLYCESVKSGRGEDEEKKLTHISLKDSCISSVRWNPANQDEVVCTFLNKNEVSIFDIGYESSEPAEILITRPTVSVHGSSRRKGLSDIALFNDSRVLASDTYGIISLWDRRAGYFPQTGLTTNINIGLTSIQLNGDQCVYGASKSGYIHIWDLRGGRSSAAFQSHQEVHSPPLTSIKLASLLNNIGPLKAQSHILPKEIHSININPSCPYQLGFHLDDGWSGVLDVQKFQVSHIHCPPPPWLDGATSNPLLPPRKPSWLPEHSIYVVGSTSSNELHLLDFYPSTSSPCHVDYDDSKSLGETPHHKQNILVPLSEGVTVCATHPLNGTIVAGTMNASLLMISQDHRSCKDEGVDGLNLP